MTTLALIHSPLVGPGTWAPLSPRLDRLGFQVAVPRLVDHATDSRPYWEQHADSAAAAIDATGADPACVLVGHSGAGPLLPAIGLRLKHPPVGFVFIDASLPSQGASRLELMQAESPEWARNLEEQLRAGGRFPTWSDQGLRSSIPDDDARRQVLAEVNPRGLDYFSEPLPAPENWPPKCCGYIQFTDTYAGPAAQASRLGWPMEQVKGSHFQMLVDAYGVAHALTSMVARILEFA